MSSPFLYIVFRVWRVTFLRWFEGGWPIGEWEECRTGTERLLSAVARGDAVVSSGDETHLSHGDDDDDNADSVRIEVCTVRLMARDIVHECALRSLYGDRWRIFGFLGGMLSARFR